MKNKNYYEILGVAPHVGSGQIQAAYRFTRGLYFGETTPTYGLLDPEERSQMLALVEEAYAALSNPNVRRDYDAHLAAEASRRQPSPEARPSGPPAAAARPRPSAPVSPSPERARAEGAPEATRVPELVNGSVLRALRESRQLSVEQIAALSKVGSRFLRALEEDRHDALPGRVFARGFLIEYARAIRAPESEIVERYLQHWTGK